jgi:hypothetical protein
VDKALPVPVSALAPATPRGAEADRTTGYNLEFLSNLLFRDQVFNAFSAYLIGVLMGLTFL